MSRIADVKRLVSTIRAHGSPADIALLEAEVFGVRPPKAVRGRLDELAGYFPELDLDALERLPDRTLGREYARLLRAGGYQPFHLGPDLRARAPGRTFVLRYMATHDFIHVLTGFDTSYAGEMGVLALTVAQGFAPGGRLQQLLASALYPLRDWRHRREIAANRRLGAAMGRRASCLLLPRYEARVAEPVADLRAELGLPDPARARLTSPLARAAA